MTNYHFSITNLKNIIIFTILISFPTITNESFARYFGSIASSIKKGTIDNFITKKKEMNSLIKKFYVGWRPLYKSNILSNVLQVITNTYIPSELGGGRLYYHAFCYFELENGNSFIVEYSQEGITIKEGNFSDFKNETLFFVKDKYYYKFHKIHYLDLKIKNKGNLLNILNDLNNEWKAENYNFATHNCQLFVCKFIEKLNAERGNKENGRGNHLFSSFSIPFEILEELEKNEKIGIRLPIIGFINDVFKNTRTTCDNF